MYTLPEAEILGIRSFFRDLSFEQHPRPWKGAWEPKIEVSGTKNDNIFNHRLGLSVIPTRSQETNPCHLLLSCCICGSVDGLLQLWVKLGLDGDSLEYTCGYVLALCLSLLALSLLP